VARLDPKPPKVRLEFQLLASQSAMMRFRKAASGSIPLPARQLSAMCAGFTVPGITHVAAGWARTNFSRICAQLVQTDLARPVRQRPVSEAPQKTARAWGGNGNCAAPAEFRM
jgi:hypothetical protein